MKAERMVAILTKADGWNYADEFGLLLSGLDENEDDSGVKNWKGNSTFDILVAYGLEETEFEFLSGFVPYTVNWNVNKSETKDVKYSWYKAYDTGIANGYIGSHNDATRGGVVLAWKENKE